MHRREFLGHSAVATLGFSLRPLLLWSQDKPAREEKLASPPSFDILTRNLEQQILKVLDETSFPDSQSS